MKIEDFGEKIGGAKKELWQRRGLQISDLSDLNEKEKLKFITKDHIWKKPDYQKMVDAGVPVRVAYFIKSVRDALPTKPNINSYDQKDLDLQQKRYISFISEMRDALLELKSENDVISFYPKFIQNRYIKQDGYSIVATNRAEGLFNDKLYQNTKVRNWYKIDREIAKKQFCYSEEDKLLAGYEVYHYDNKQIIFQPDFRGESAIIIKTEFGRSYHYPKEELAKAENWIEGTYFLMRTDVIVANNFNTMEEARSYALDLEKARDIGSTPSPRTTPVQKRQRKKAFVPPQLQHIKRTGENYRNGRNITGTDYLETFGFRGGEFGNWMNENDRQQSLNYGYDALLDMCKALCINPKDVSLNRTLAIAFGARGEGSALAHYESLQTVINLTKMKGAGSLAHEWAHALDDFIGNTIGFELEHSMASGHVDSNRNLSTIKKVMETIKYKLESSPERVEIQKKEYEDQKKTLQVVLNTRLSAIPEEHAAELAELKSAYINARNPDERDHVLMLISTIQKNSIGVELSPEIKNLINSFHIRMLESENRIGYPVKVKTDFYKNSIMFDEVSAKTTHGYWQCNEELFARAFACYIHDKVDGRSDYLCGHANSAITNKIREDGGIEWIKAFPLGEERKQINQCFDELMIELKEKGYVHHYEFSSYKEEKLDSIKESSQQEQAMIPLTTDENGQTTFDLDLDDLEL